MKKRKHGENYTAFVEPNLSASTLTIFIHGIGGNHTDEYWMNVPELVRNDVKLATHDLYFWGYSTSKNPFANFMHGVLPRKRVASVDEVALDLRTFVESLTQKKTYRRLALVGHSLGGFVALQTALQMKEIGLDIETYCMMLASPQAAPMVARAALLVSRSNPQLWVLGSRAQINRYCENAVEAAKTFCKEVSYTNYSQDEILVASSNIEFSRRLGCQARHTWMSEPATSRTPAYALMVDWLEGVSRK